MKVINATGANEQQKAMLEQDSDSRPIQMLNLLKFKEKAEYEDGRETELTGLQAYDLYTEGFFPALAEHQGEVVHYSEATGLFVGEVEELWDRVLIIKYPSRKHFAAMIASDIFKQVSVHRIAGLAGQINIECRDVAL